MLCGTARLVYACTNSNGTSCQKTALNALETSAPVNGSCGAGQFVLLTPGEYAWSTESPFRLSIAEAGAIGTAIIGVLAAAWAIRALSRAIYGGDPET